jgi:hypothetical protein
MIGTNPTSPFVGAGNYYLKVIDKNGIQLPVHP